jgi:hypothetical protein
MSEIYNNNLIQVTLISKMKNHKSFFFSLSQSAFSPSLGLVQPLALAAKGFSSAIGS